MSIKTSRWIKLPRRSPCLSDRTDTGWPDLGPAAPPRLFCCLLCTVCTVHTAEHCTSDRLIQTDLVWPRALFHQREEDSRGFLRNYFVRSRYIMKWVLGLRFLKFGTIDIQRRYRFQYWGTLGIPPVRDLVMAWTSHNQFMNLMCHLGQMVQNY